MTAQEGALAEEDGRILAALVADWDAPDFLAVRALAALGEERDERLARGTAMGREFVVEVRRRAREAGANAMLADPMTVGERVLEIASHEIARPGRELAMSALAEETGIPSRTLYNRYATRADLVAACRRRAETVWRARFEMRVRSIGGEPRARLVAVVDEIGAWVASERFVRDEALRGRGGELREHLAETERFAAELAHHAGLRRPERFAAFVATLVAGAGAWAGREEAARAAARAAVEALANEVAVR